MWPPLRTLRRAVRGRVKGPSSPSATKTQESLNPQVMLTLPRGNGRHGAWHILEHLGNGVGPVPLADGLALANSHLCCRKQMGLVM